MLSWLYRLRHFFILSITLAGHWHFSPLRFFAQPLPFHTTVSLLPAISDGCLIVAIAMLLASLSIYATAIFRSASAVSLSMPPIRAPPSHFACAARRATIFSFFAAAAPRAARAFAAAAFRRRRRRARRRRCRRRRAAAITRQIIIGYITNTLLPASNRLPGHTPDFLLATMTPLACQIGWLLSFAGQPSDSRHTGRFSAPGQPLRRSPRRLFLRLMAARQPLPSLSPTNEGQFAISRRFEYRFHCYCIATLFAAAASLLLHVSSRLPRFLHTSLVSFRQYFVIRFSFCIVLRVIYY